MGFRNPLNLPPGSIGGSLLAADAIDGKTITGAHIRSAASGTRWELDSSDVAFTNRFLGYSDDPTTEPGGLVLPNGNAEVQLLQPRLASNPTPGSLAFFNVDGGTVRAELTSQQGAFVHPAGAAYTIEWADGNLTVPGRVRAKDSLFSQAYSGTTDASGYLVIAHAAGFVPTGGWAVTGNPTSSFAHFWGIDSLALTSVRVRFANVAGTGALASTAVAGRLFLVAP